MTVTGYPAIKAVTDALIRKALDGGVHYAPAGTTAPTLTTLFDATTGTLTTPLPTGFADLGYLTAAGVVCSRKVTTSNVTSAFSAVPTRTDITADEVTWKFACQETNLHTIAFFNGLDESTISTTTNAGGAIEIDRPVVPTTKYYRLLAFGVDEDADGETIIARFLPKARITDYDDQTFALGNDPILSGVTVTGYLDDTLGYSEAVFYGGDGWLAKLTAMGFTAHS